MPGFDSTPSMQQTGCQRSGGPGTMAGFAGEQELLPGLGLAAEAQRYKIEELLGKGSYGVVCSALDRLTGERVAIKRIPNVFASVADATRILREVKLLRLLKHADIVSIKHIMLPSDPRSFSNLYVVFELMESDLHTVIGANEEFSQDHHRVFLYQLLRGLTHIHAAGVLHRDLKPKNILANSNCKLKICDFGLARPVVQSSTPVMWTDYVATRWYRAPELCGCFYGCYSQAVDIWAVGCIFAEVLLGRPLFPGKDAVTQLTRITDLLGKPPAHVIDSIPNHKARAFLHGLPPKPARPFAEVFPNAAPEALALLARLLSFDPAHRPTAAEALGDAYFAALPGAGSADDLVSLYKDIRQDFLFETEKLSEADVRALLYQEVLHYHPEVKAAYTAYTSSLLSTGWGSGAPRQAPLQASASDADLRGQFMQAEEAAQDKAAAMVGSLGDTPSVMQAAPVAQADMGQQQQQGQAQAQPQPPPMGPLLLHQQLPHLQQALLLQQGLLQQQVLQQQQQQQQALQQQQMQALQQQAHQPIRTAPLPGSLESGSWLFGPEFAAAQGMADEAPAPGSVSTSLESGAGGLGSMHASLAMWPSGMEAWLPHQLAAAAATAAASAAAGNGRYMLPQASPRLAADAVAAAAAAAMAASAAAEHARMQHAMGPLAADARTSLLGLVQLSEAILMQSIPAPGQGRLAEAVAAASGGGDPSPLPASHDAAFPLHPRGAHVGMAAAGANSGSFYSLSSLLAGEDAGRELLLRHLSGGLSC